MDSYQFTRPIGGYIMYQHYVPSEVYDFIYNYTGFSSAIYDQTPDRKFILSQKIAWKTGFPSGMDYTFVQARLFETGKPVKIIRLSSLPETKESDWKIYSD